MKIFVSHLEEKRKDRQLKLLVHDRKHKHTFSSYTAIIVSPIARIIYEHAGKIIYKLNNRKEIRKSRIDLTRVKNFMIQSTS